MHLLRITQPIDQYNQRNYKKANTENKELELSDYSSIQARNSKK